MPTFNLAKTTSAWSPDISSYKMMVEVTSAVDAPSEIFVIKRTRDFVKDQFDDVFAAIATPTQLEDFPVLAPNENSSYYRTNKATLIVRTAEGMQAVFDSMVYEIKKLATDLEAINNGLSYTSTYEISGDIASLNNIGSNPGNPSTPITAIPTPHAATHTIGGTDPITISASQVIGLSPVAISNSYTDLTDKPNFALKSEIPTNYATLVNGLVPASQLPSYVDDVLEYVATTNFPTTGESGKIYVSTSTNLTYRWSGSTYIEISPSTGQVQSDWNATSGLGNILNKPTLFSGSYTDLTNKPSIPATQVQSDWNQATSTALDFIKNKPTIPVVGTAAAKDIPASGNASTSQVVYGTDTRLTDARTPASHTHTLSDLTQSSATTGQVATWNGTAWAATTPSPGGVTSVNGSTGAITNVVQSSNASILQIVKMTAAEYAAVTTKVATTLYVIVG